ncbi:histidinol dehydrogenase [Segniliparus rugosus]|uniref:Histidinol dehydrogenase n=1 Tax=Segniliparus rugosus (strain ATCC BAA-974 / DSM 45345 / CCUG 50838 / CIP 108380 / JCM 13579 / CDC 945) TaxID=679197 RepID=E5XSW9_SEGRC|nr:histidinol dehydrogenase [Segniliparus rugosus]EFV12548.2 histidinol dehydrogenase [Segniliparus rugosus ATCC BAA-974]
MPDPSPLLRRIDLRGRAYSAKELRDIVPRGEVAVDSVAGTVAAIVREVAEGGAKAALDFGERFDGVRPARARVPAEALAAAEAALDPPVRAALLEAIARARRGHQAQLRQESTTVLADGATVRQRWVPVERVGLYVPGGKAVYPSSVVMNVVPAQVAGVRSIVVASPPQRSNDGLPHPLVLAAAALLGVDEVWAVGGAQSVALMAYGGTDTDGAELAPVDVITGPGNVFVAAAKRLVRSRVGIDAEAGPSEILVLADDAANPAHVAADLISQAEHDENAASVLVTPSERLAEAVEAELARQLPAADRQTQLRAALAGPQSAVVLVDDLAQGIAVANAHAPEHLEVITKDAAAVADQVTAAGAVFVGPWAPVSLGDYCAGSNHVLPTASTARHSSGLEVGVFLRGMQVVEYTEQALKEVAGHVQALAAAEQLPAHGEAIKARFA